MDKSYSSRDLTLSLINSPPPTLWILTGDRSVGKTYRCVELVSYLKETSFSLGGILSPPIYRNNQKVAIQIQDVQTGQSRILGCIEASDSCRLNIGDWWLNPDAIKWGNQIIKNAASRDIVIIDEIGPLELEFNQGFTEAIQLLDNKKFKRVLAVVRPELLNIALSRWNLAKTIYVEKNAQ